jgi:hypothetical protein
MNLHTACVIRFKNSTQKKRVNLCVYSKYECTYLKMMIAGVIHSAAVPQVVRCGKTVF